MHRKTLSFATSLFALCLMLFLQTASHASQPGYIYTYGSYLQNGCGTQVNICLYDYGTHRTGKVLITTLSGILQAQTLNVTYNAVNGKLCTDATISGQGTFTATVAGVRVATPGLYTAHVWKGLVNGVNANWVQAEIWSVDGKTLLYATGPTWPCLSSIPVKMTNATMMTYIP